MADVGAFLKRSSVPKIIFLTIDAYGISEQNATLIADIDGYLVGFARGFSRPLDELEVFSSEEFFARKRGKVFGRWHDLVAKHERKFINFGHFVAETEFGWTSLDSRPNKVVVPGQMYVRRKEARRKLSRQGNLGAIRQFQTLDVRHGSCRSAPPHAAVLAIAVQPDLQPEHCERALCLHRRLRL